MSNEKLNSVEWLYRELTEILCDVEVNPVKAIAIFDRLKQAKTMHKEEIMQAYSDGLGNGIAYADGQARNTVLDELKYYDEIFNSNV